MIKTKIGDGKHTHFWTDEWRLEGKIADICPRMFILETHKEAIVADRAGVDTREWQRRRPPRGSCELEELESLHVILADTVLNDKEDEWIVPSAPDKSYSTKWMRKQISDYRFTEEATFNRWNKWLPKKINIFMWRIFKGRIPTKTVLQRLGANIPYTICNSCATEDETLAHIFLKCGVAQELRQIFNLWKKHIIGLELGLPSREKSPKSAPARSRTPDLRPCEDYNPVPLPRPQLSEDYEIGRGANEPSRARIPPSSARARLSCCRLELELGSFKVWYPSSSSAREKCKKLEFGSARLVYLSSLNEPRLGLQRDFFWGYETGAKYIPWIKWDYACMDKNQGGLGIGALDFMNKWLFGKWIWRFSQEQNALWVKIISSIHGEEGGLEDNWRAKGPLAATFPRMFALESNKNIMVADRINTEIGEWQRRRHPRGGREQEELKNLLDIIGSITLSDAKDKWILPNALDNIYTTKWMRNQFMEQRY
ncbi:hypothetical protein LXL04_004827 [Taraxacum kok-saghyz]